MERPENIFSQRIKQAHLQFAQANAQTENCKRAYFTNRTDTATLDGQTMDEKEGRRHNTGSRCTTPLYRISSSVSLNLSALEAFQEQ